MWESKLPHWLWKLTQDINPGTNVLQIRAIRPSAWYFRKGLFLRKGEKHRYPSHIIHCGLLFLDGHGSTVHVRTDLAMWQQSNGNHVQHMLYVQTDICWGGNTCFDILYLWFGETSKQKIPVKWLIAVDYTNSSFGLRIKLTGPLKWIDYTMDPIQVPVPMIHQKWVSGLWQGKF